MSLKLDLCAAIFLIGSEMPAKAHDIYSHLKDRLGNSCCNEQDCRPAPYQVTPSGVHILVNGSWIAVPNYRVQYRTLPGDTGEQAGPLVRGHPPHGRPRDGLLNLLRDPTA